MSWPTSGMVAPDFSHSTLRSSRGDGGSGSSSFFTHAGVPWVFRRLSQGRLFGVCCFSGCRPGRGGGGAEREARSRPDGDGGKGAERQRGRGRRGRGGQLAAPRAPGAERGAEPSQPA